MGVGGLACAGLAERLQPRAAQIAPPWGANGR
jgi:hypothetical protein